MSRSRPLPVPVLRRVVHGATRAPSVHNTQPWRWRATGGCLELHLDPARRLLATDPDGRSATISCGAALHHAQVVAGALGWSSTVVRHPEGPAASLLARIQHEPAAPPHDAAALLEAVEVRFTDRRRFTSWPIPQDRLAHLVDVARAWGAEATVVTDARDRLRAERLVLQAGALQARSRRTAEERDAWVDRRTPDGIPAAVLTRSGVRADAHPHRYESVPDTDLEGQDLRDADSLMVLHAENDDPPSWLRAGEGLSALWLTATSLGLSVVPLSQATEVDEVREALRHQVLGGAGHALLLARIGWQEIGRSEQPRTPRRPVDEVLDLA